MTAAPIQITSDLDDRVDATLAAIRDVGEAMARVIADLHDIVAGLRPQGPPVVVGGLMVTSGGRVYPPSLERALSDTELRTLVLAARAYPDAFDAEGPVDGPQVTRVALRMRLSRMRPHLRAHGADLVARRGRPPSGVAPLWYRLVAIRREEVACDVE